MKVTLTHIIEGQKIQAIKGIRGITGCGLKEAKEIADALPNAFIRGEGYVGDSKGEPRTIEVRRSAYLADEAETARWVHRVLDECGGVGYEPITVNLLSRVRARLRRYRRRLRVGWSNGQVFRVMPVYVTRPNADGQTATWSINAAVGITAVLMTFANIILWGVVGVITAVGLL